MTGKTHKLGGAVAGVLLLKLHNEDIIATGIVMTGAILGSLLPDIDHPKSTISRKLWFISWPLAIMRAIVKAVATALPRKEQRNINSIVGHRGITHSLLACVSVAVGLSILGAVIRVSKDEYLAYYIYLVVSVVAGMVSHIVLDFFSNGIPLFCPFMNKRMGFKWIKTGSVSESVVAIFILVILCWLIGREGMTWIVSRL